MSIKCDRCGHEMDDSWKIESIEGVGGKCSECGDNLCAQCAMWNKNNVCCVCALVDEVEGKN